MPDDDPLDGADIGETVTVSETTDIWLGDLEGVGTRGSDRFSERRLENVEVVTDEYGDTRLRVTVESDVTKRLPRRWDESQTPRTQSEHRVALAKRVGSALATAIPMAVALAIAFVVTSRVNQRLFSEVMINGEPLGPAPMAPVVVGVSVIALIVVLMPYLPGMAGVGR